MGYASANPIAITEMVALYRILTQLHYLSAQELIDLWSMMDNECLIYWEEQRPKS